MSDIEINLPKHLAEKAHREKKLKELLAGHTYSHAFWNLYNSWLEVMEAKIKEFLSQPPETVPEWATTIKLTATLPTPGKAGHVAWTQGPPLV